MAGTIILIVITAIIIALCAIILSGKGDNLIAGYKTASEKERQQYNIKRLRLVVALMCLMPILVCCIAHPNGRHVDQTERVKMICSTTITEPIKHPLWVVDGKIYGNLVLDSVILSSQNAKELIPMVLNSIGISISAEEIKDYKVLTPDDGHAVLGEHGLAGAITIFPPKYGSAIFGVRGSAGAIIVTTKKKIKRNNK